ncbi:kinase-like domain-containing protein [Syncephalis fuscata]|nr:kinase-like domain-containing protein [Syncephalis fuscata]
MGHFWLFRLFAKHNLDDDQSSTGTGSIHSARKSDLRKSNTEPLSPKRLLASSPHTIDVIGSTSSTTSLPAVHYNASCISSEIRRGANGRGQYTVFRVHVSYESDQWWLFKRYSEFRALHAQLRKDYPQRGLPSLPARRFFGDNFSKSFLTKRRAGLHAYLLGIVDDSVIRRSVPLLEFFDDGRRVLQQAHGFQPRHLGSASSRLSTSTNNTARSLSAMIGMKRVISLASSKSAPHPTLAAQRSSAAAGRSKAVPGSRSRAGSLASVRKGGEMRKLAPAAPVSRSRTASAAVSIDENTATKQPTGSSSETSSTTVVTKNAASKPNHKMGLDDFCLLSVIGKGSYGKVMLARHKETGTVYAIKAISKSKIRGRPADIRRVMSEREVLRCNAAHPFLIGLRYSFQSAQKLYLCVDYVSGGELFFHLQRDRRFPEARARFYACEILSALEYLHDLGFVYRDLKPENLLLDSEGHIRLVDFGLAKNTGEGKTSTFCGTPEYLAPEVLKRQRYGKEVDWYCFGSVLYEMLVGLPPFYSPDDRDMFDRILHERVRFPNFVSKAARVLIVNLLERNPKLRLGSRGAEEVKNQAFFRGINWDRVYHKQYPVPFDPQVAVLWEPIPNSLLGEIRNSNYLSQAREAHKDAFDEIFDVPGLDDNSGHTTDKQRNANGARRDNDDNEDDFIDPHGDEWDATVDRVMNERVTEAEIQRQVDTAFVGFSYVPEGTLASPLSASRV